MSFYEKLFLLYENKAQLDSKGIKIILKFHQQLK